MTRRTHIVDFDEARTYAASGSARAAARVSASQRLERRQARQSHRRARDAGEAGIKRGNSLPFSRRALARNVSTRAGTRYPEEWDIEDSLGFDDYGQYAYDESYDASASDTYDEAYDEEEQEQVPQEGLIKRFQRRNRKRRAERMANRTFDDAPSSAADASREQSRAAVYEMKMGSKHRSMVRSQSTTTKKRISLPRIHRDTDRPSIFQSTILRVIVGTLVCMIAVVAFLYPAAKDFYVAKRDYAKAEAAVQLAQERNAILEQDVAALSTPQGIEDRVRSEYGWVKEGENAVTVTGLRDANDGAERLEELPAVESVKAPDTWYSNVLDPIFGYEG